MAMSRQLERRAKWFAAIVIYYVSSLVSIKWKVSVDRWKRIDRAFRLFALFAGIWTVRNKTHGDNSPRTITWSRWTETNDRLQAFHPGIILPDFQSLSHVLNLCPLLYRPTLRTVVSEMSLLKTIARPLTVIRWLAHLRR